MKATACQAAAAAERPGTVEPATEPEVLETEEADLLTHVAEGKEANLPRPATEREGADLPTLEEKGADVLNLVAK